MFFPRSKCVYASWVCPLHVLVGEKSVIQEDGTHPEVTSPTGVSTHTFYIPFLNATRPSSHLALP
jgi:hypothetical protein